MSRPQQLRRVAEFLILYFVLPTLVWWSGTKMYLVILGAMAVGALLLLRGDPTYDRSALFRPASVRKDARRILIRFAILAPLILAATWILTPDLLFRFPRERTALWLAILFGYPWVSVYPQGLIYRALFLHRYGALFPHPVLRCLVGGVIFSFLHIVFENPVALTVTFIGGIMFTRTHERTGALLSSSLEHALYGLWLMTTGWGAFLYPDAVEPAMEILRGSP